MKKIKPKRGKAFLDFLRRAAETVDKWPHWMRGERKPKGKWRLK